MANKTINQLPADTILLATDKLAKQSSGNVTKNVTAQMVSDFIVSNLPAMDLSTVLGTGNNTGANNILVNRSQKITTADNNKGIQFGYGAPANTDNFIVFGDMINFFTPPSSGIYNFFGIYNNDLVIRGQDFSVGGTSASATISGGEIFTIEVKETDEPDRYVRGRFDKLEINLIGNNTDFNSYVRVKADRIRLVTSDLINHISTSSTYSPALITLNASNNNTHETNRFTIASTYVNISSNDVYAMNKGYRLFAEFVKSSTDDDIVDIINVSNSTMILYTILVFNVIVYGRNESSTIFLTHEITASFYNNGLTFIPIGTEDNTIKGINVTGEEISLDVVGDELVVTAKGIIGEIYNWSAMVEIKANNGLNLNII